MEKLISVIIPTYNRASMLPRAIESVLRQNYQNIEIIVIDDCSQDDTEYVVSKINDPRIKFLRLQFNSGVAVARNLGLRQSKGDYIAFLDSDDEFLPGKLSKQTEVFEKIFPVPGLVITNYCQKGEVNCLIIDKKIHAGFINVGNKFPADVFNGPPSWMISRICVNKVGFFDEELRTLEDLDYFARAVREMPVYYVNEPLSLIHVHSYPAGRAPDRYSEYTRRRILAKWMPQMKRDPRFLSDFYYVAGKDLLRARKPYKAVGWLWRALITDLRNFRVLRKLIQSIFRSVLIFLNMRVADNSGRFRKYKSIMIINPYGIGDVLFSTPLVRNLHESYPQAKIYYLSNQRTECVLRDNPLIEEIFVYDRDEFVKLRKVSVFKWIRKHFELLGKIREKKIELAIDLSLNTFLGAITLLAGTKTRVGLDYHKRGRLLTKKVTIEGFDDKHVAEYHLDLLDAMGLPVRKTGLEIFTNTRSREFIDAKFKVKFNGRTGPYIGIAPLGGETWGEHASRKRWPPEYYASLIDKIVEKYNARILIYGGAKDKDALAYIKSKIAQKDSCCVLADHSFEQVIASIDKCSLFISNDTGLLRFADALRKKIIAFFGPVDEKVYGMFPFNRERHIYMTKNLPCRPCYKRFRLGKCERDMACLREITVNEAFEAVEKLLNDDNLKLLGESK